jgi:hypothetical protein
VYLGSGENAILNPSNDTWFEPFDLSQPYLWAGAALVSFGRLERSSRGWVEPSRAHCPGARLQNGIASAPNRSGRLRWVEWPAPAADAA